MVYSIYNSMDFVETGISGIASQNQCKKNKTIKMNEMLDPEGEGGRGVEVPAGRVA